MTNQSREADRIEMMEGKINALLLQVASMRCVLPYVAVGRVPTDDDAKAFFRDFSLFAGAPSYVEGAFVAMVESVTADVRTIQSQRKPH